MIPQGREDHVLLVILEAADDVAGGGAHLAGHPPLLPAQCCYAILAVFEVAGPHSHYPGQNPGNPETEKYFPLLLQKAKRSYSCQKSQTQEQNMKSNTF